MISKTQFNQGRDMFLLRWLPLGVISLFVLFPFYWTVNTSLKREGDILNKVLAYLPDPATVDNFVNAFKKVGFHIYFKNSLIVSSAAVGITVLCSVIVSYALSRFRFKGKNVFLIVLLTTQFMPGAMLLVPLFLIFKNMGLLGTHMSLIFTYVSFQLPFNAVLMRGFFSNVPIQIDEAAAIDGCTRFQTIIYVLLPVLVPGIVASAAFAFVGCWNEYLFALMFLSKSHMFTVPVGISYMMGQYSINYGTLAAAGIVALVPPIMLFAYIQKYLVQGLSAGSVKG